MRRLDRSEALRGWLLPAILLYCGQYFISLTQDLGPVIETDAVNLFYHGRLYNEFAWLIPMIVCLPFAMKFCDDWQSRFFHMQVWRSSPGRYIRSKLWYTWLTAGITAVAGTLLFFIILCILAEVPHYPAEDVSESVSYLLERSGSLEYYVFEVLFLNFFYGGLWALTGLAFSTFVPYKSLALCFPAFLNRIWNVVILAHFDLPLWTHVDALGLGLIRIHPPGITMLIAAGVFAAPSVICCLLFDYGVRRRLEHG